ESGALPEEDMWQDIYERCQELLGIDTAREALAEWELMWEVAYHSREVCDVRHPLWGRRAPEQEQANRLGLQQALDALRAFELERLWVLGDAPHYPPGGSRANSG